MAARSEFVARYFNNEQISLSTDDKAEPRGTAYSQNSRDAFSSQKALEEKRDSIAKQPKIGPHANEIIKCNTQIRILVSLNEFDH